MFHSVIFDFDGLILDTETPLYDSWRLTYEEYGVAPISIGEWALSLGRHDDDPLLLDPLVRLAEQVSGIDTEVVQARRRHRRDELLGAERIRPGVAALLDEAAALGIPTAIASSSSIDWVEAHLARHDMLRRFTILACAGFDVPGKPDPAVYLAACEALHVDPTESLAFEDSPNGVAAAKAAGLACVAVPTDMSRTLDFRDADRIVDSLADVSISRLHRNLSRLG